MAGASRFGKLLPWRKFRAVAPGQNMAQVLPPQVFQEVVVINQHIPKALAFRRHQQRRGAVMPPQQVAVPFLQGKQAVLYILMRFGSVRFNEMKRHWQHFRQNPERHIEGAGGGPAGQPGGQIPPKVEYSPGERPCSPFWTVCANGGNRTGCKAGISAECPLILPMELCYNSGSYNRREDFHVRTFQVA